MLTNAQAQYFSTATENYDAFSRLKTLAASVIWLAVRDYHTAHNLGDNARTPVNARVREAKKAECVRFLTSSTHWHDVLNIPPLTLKQIQEAESVLRLYRVQP